MINTGVRDELKTRTTLYSSQNEVVGVFNSKTEAAMYAASHFNCSKTSLMKYNRSKGFLVKMDYNPKLNKTKKKIEYLLYSPDNKFLGAFPSIRAAGMYIKENIRDISIKLFQKTRKTYGYYVIEKSVETNCNSGDKHQSEAQSSQ